MAKVGRKPLPIEEKRIFTMTGRFTMGQITEYEEKVKKFWKKEPNWKAKVVQEAVPNWINQKMRDLGRER